MGPSSDYRLAEQNRDGNEDAADDKGKHEGRPAIFTDNVREPPDVAQPYCRTGHGHDDGSSAAEMLSPGIHSMKLEMNIVRTAIGAMYLMRK